MAQTGYSPILLYSSSTASAAPLAGNLTNSTTGSELGINITDGKLFYKDNANAIQVIGWKVRPASAGGTGLTSFAVGDLLYADTTTTLAKLADVATGNALISGGVSTAPSWGKIGLTTHVSGTLPVANGGTNLTSFTANGVMYASSTSALATSSNLTWDGTTFINAGGSIRASAGSYSSFYSTNQDGAYPSNYINSAGGDSQVSIAANWFSGQRDLSIINSNIAGGGFGFYQMTSSSAKTRLISFNTGTFQPGVDNTMTLGGSSFRWTTVYATTAVINTSDQNDKQQIADLTITEQTVAKALKGLFKTYKLNSAVALKGDKARIHVGIMAQDVYQTFVNQGLDPTKYALFCSDTWQEYNGHPVNVDSNNMYDLLTGYTLDGQTVTLNNGDVVPQGATQVYTKVATTTVTKLGIRYAELMAFIISAL